MSIQAVTHAVNVRREGRTVVILDQTLLPNRTEYLTLSEPGELWEAIHALRIRGAPAIGIFAAYSMAVLAAGIDAPDFDGFYREYRRLSDYLNSSRPTAVNLSHMLRRMDGVVLAHRDAPRAALLAALDREAAAIHQEDMDMCRAISEYGLSLLHDGDNVLTHCNAGPLATSRYGTAQGPFYLAQERGVRLHVWVDETRPLLQGARLSAYELSADGVDTTVICDNMASQVMKNGWIDAVLIGADRIAANGDTCNKIGTSGVAILAKHYGIPFYVCAPLSTIDTTLPSGAGIPIEQRPGEEVTEMWYQRRMAPQNVKIYNPAFDVTDAELITGIVTEYGVLRPDYTRSIAEIFARKA